MAVLDTLTRGVRALFATARLLGVESDTFVVGLPNEPHRARGETRVAEVAAALAARVGRPVEIRLVVDASAAAPPEEIRPDDEATDEDPTSGSIARSPSSARSVAEAAVGPPPASRGRDEQYAEDKIDLQDLEDAGPGQVASGIDLVLKAFGPRTRLIEE